MRYSGNYVLSEIRFPRISERCVLLFSFYASLITSLTLLDSICEELSFVITIDESTLLMSDIIYDVVSRMCNLGRVDYSTYFPVRRAPVNVIKETCCNAPRLRFIVVRHDCSSV